MHTVTGNLYHLISLFSCASVCPGLALVTCCAIKISNIKDFREAMPFAKWKWPCPIKDEIPGLEKSATQKIQFVTHSPALTVLSFYLCIFFKPKFVLCDQLKRMRSLALRSTCRMYSTVCRVLLRFFQNRAAFWTNFLNIIWPKHAKFKQHLWNVFYCCLSWF